jgi:hypothetical protein
MAETDTTLETKRAQIEGKLTALRPSPGVADLVRQADRAIAAHRAELDAHERDLAEIDQQAGIRERDRREAAAQQKQDRWLGMRQQLLKEEEQRLQAVEEAEQATRALVKAIDEIIASSARMSKLAQELSADRKAPSALNPMELVSRLGSRIAAVMMTIKGHHFRFGAITWPSAASGLYPANGPAWKDDEEQRMARALIGPLLQHGKA